MAGARATYPITPLMFASALVQYNSGTHSASTKVRLRWEYQPGIWPEGRPGGVPDLSRGPGRTGLGRYRRGAEQVPQVLAAAYDNRRRFR
jgi:hypothetical protein